MKGEAKVSRTKDSERCKEGVRELNYRTTLHPP